MKGESLRKKYWESTYLISQMCVSKIKICTCLDEKQLLSFFCEFFELLCVHSFPSLPIDRHIQSCSLNTAVSGMAMAKATGTGG